MLRFLPSMRLGIAVATRVGFALDANGLLAGHALNAELAQGFNDGLLMHINAGAPLELVADFTQRGGAV